MDDATITPAGRCQLESWLQTLSGGQKFLSTVPACSTGPVEWSIGLAGQANPYQHQESPAIKWLIQDGAKQAFGVAVSVGATWSNGHVLTRDTYGVVTWVPDEARRWAINGDLGAIDVRDDHWRALAGLGVEYKASKRLTLLAEHIRPWAKAGVTQAGLRWIMASNSIDFILGRSSASEHDRWLTLGLNLAF